MFSLIYSALTVYAISKSYKCENFGVLVVFLIVADLIALNIIFN